MRQIPRTGHGAPMRQVLAVSTGGTDQPVLIADEDDGDRGRLGLLLRDAGHAVIETSSGDDVIRTVREIDLSLVILEVALRDVSGYEVCRTIREEVGHDLPVLFLSGLRTAPYDRVGGLLLGADDYVVKPYARDELMARIRALLRRSRAGTSRRALGLTARETEDFALRSEGLTNDEIAARLFISPKTVGTHLENVFGKLGARSRAEAVAIAYRQGFASVTHRRVKRAVARRS